MPTVPASNRLAALKRHVLIAVAAFVVHGAGGGVDGYGVVGGGAGVVGLGGHFGVARGGLVECGFR